MIDPKVKKFRSIETPQYAAISAYNKEFLYSTGICESLSSILSKVWAVGSDIHIYEVTPNYRLIAAYYGENILD